jgi:hypothetical protein
MQRAITLMLLVFGMTAMVAGDAPAASRQAIRTVVEGRPGVVHLAPGFTTAVRVPDTVNSVILGDPGLFQAEHSPDEPLFVFVKPVTPEPAETNLLIVTSIGRQFSLVLVSEGAQQTQSPPDIDLLVVCRPAGSLLIPEAWPSSLVAETLPVEAVAGDRSFDSDALPDPEEQRRNLLGQQQNRRLADVQGEGLEVSIGEVLPLGSEVAVLFSVVNSTAEPIELTSPQVQLAGGTEAGFVTRSTRWTTVDQIPVSAYQLTRRRLEPGERADGFVVFTRPAIKQSNENLLLQIAQTAAIDEPVLVPFEWY